MVVASLYGDGVDGRSSDQHLDETVVAGLIAAQFPDLGEMAVKRFGGGWDHELFGCGEWIFRFPRRAERVAWFRREIVILDAAGSALSGAGVGRVPVFERLGVPGEAFPYPFAGYRRVEGVGADQMPVADPRRLAREVGALFSALHRVDPDTIPPTPDGWEKESWAELRDELVPAAELVRAELGFDPGLLAAAEPYLRGEMGEPAQDGPRRFIHNDICPDHLIVEPGSGRLVGLIDFTDAMVGPPVLDFAGLIGVGGYPFIRQVVAAYELPLGDGSGEQLEWLCRVLTLTWLADAAGSDRDSLAKHRGWVARAFGE